MDDEDKDGFTWETAYERTWEAVHEDEGGSVSASVASLVHHARRRRQLATSAGQCIRLGIMRHVLVVLDGSECMLEKDLQPTRLQTCVTVLDKFVDEFFDQNPISQLGLIVTSDKRAKMISVLTGNARAHKEALSELVRMNCVGNVSLQNSLQIALTAFRRTPSHSSRELVLVMASLSTCDPSDVFAAVQTMKAHNIRCSVISLTAEVHVYKHLTTVTNGSHTVVLDETHLAQILSTFSLPPPAAKDAVSSMVRMGFPTHRHTPGLASVCACHVDLGNKASGNSQALTQSGYLCPQCQSKYCTLPVECRICGLTLVSAPQLARSYQHLSPLATFEERPVPDGDPLVCSACGRLLQVCMYVCIECNEHYCTECDLLLHQSLRSCPSCSAKRS